MHRAALGALLVTLAAGASPALASPILAPPGDPAFAPALAALADGYQRQQDVFATLENGMSLDPIFLPTEVQTVKDFFAQTATNDFEQFSGKHPYETLDHYDEHGDEGNFAGIASVGAAARLMVLKAEGAPKEQIDRAREAAVRVARAWHVYATIGGPGVIARGIRRVTPWNAGDPPFPGPMPELVPLADASGNPLPADKKPTWRAPVAPGHDGWIWFDDTSKDQVSGYILGAMFLWDALKDDPAVPPEVTADLAEDAVIFVKKLMEVTPEHGVDLSLRDADGRLTRFHDLNPRQLSPESVLPEDFSLSNGFNAALALGIVRAAYHMSGDPEIGKYYYEELIGRRDFPTSASKFSGAIFLGEETNYSNVNMLAIAFATLGRVETDPYVREKLQATLQTQFWDTGFGNRDASHVKQAWFDVVYAAHAAMPPAEIRDRVAENLGGFQMAPAFDRDRINCDDAELAAASCVGIDAMTSLEILPKPGHNGQPVANDIVPMSIRPDSDMAWRSDPHTVNGKASTRMNPGGDYLAAYWLARLTDLEDSAKNLSPHARAPLPYTLGGEDTSTGGATPPPAEADGGCSACAVSTGSGELAGILAGWSAALSLLVRRARSRRTRG
jgi:hypothetical protein